MNDMVQREIMCDGCPFNIHRVGLPVPPEVMAEVRRRVRGGERWICHQTCDGARVVEWSQYCAGARR